MEPDRVEITDLIRGWQPDGTRSPVLVADVVDRLRASGQRRAAGIVSRLPASDGVLDDRACDALAVRVHCELQRLWEELVQGRRVQETLARLVASLDPSTARPIRIVDVGCGLGYLLRWLALHGGWGPSVELVGVDLDAALVAEASRLAAAEGAVTTFVAGDAFTPGVAVVEPERTIIVSSGLLHHVPGPRLPGFFAAQEQLGVRAFAHWDPTPGLMAVVGGWVFHQARMREAVSRHDGVLSVRRAHPASVLLAAAHDGAPGYDVECTDRRRLSEIVRPVLGVRR